MEKVVHELLAPIVRSFISDKGFALFQKLTNWLDARIPSPAAKGVRAAARPGGYIASVVLATALAGF